jgi:hypothetical protein
VYKKYISVQLLSQGCRWLPGSSRSSAASPGTFWSTELLWQAAQLLCLLFWSHKAGHPPLDPLSPWCQDEGSGAGGSCLSEPQAQRNESSNPGPLSGATTWGHHVGLLSQKRPECLLLAPQNLRSAKHLSSSFLEYTSKPLLYILSPKCMQSLGRKWKESSKKAS